MNSSKKPKLVWGVLSSLAFAAAAAVTATTAKAAMISYSDSIPLTVSEFGSWEGLGPTTQ